MFVNLANAGTLHFSQSPDLIIERQDVVISPEKVTISYVFINNSQNPITENFSFPLSESTEGTVTNFQILVDSKKIKYQTKRRAISSAGEEITKILQAFNLPLSPISAIHSLDYSVNRDLIANGLKSLNLLDKREETPKWVQQTIHHWQQNFPSNATVKIQISYKPANTTKIIKVSSPAGIIKTPINIIKRTVKLAIKWTLEDDNAATHMQNQLEKRFPAMINFCPSKEDYVALATTGNKEISLQEINYNCSTESFFPAINKFSLKIEGEKNTIPMLCWNGEFKQDGNGMIFTSENYVPLRDVRVLFAKND